MILKVFQMQEASEISLKVSEQLDLKIGRTTNILQEGELVFVGRDYCRF